MKCLLERISEGEHGMGDGTSCIRDTLLCQILYIKQAERKEKGENEKEGNRKLRMCVWMCCISGYNLKKYFRGLIITT